MQNTKIKQIADLIALIFTDPEYTKLINHIKNREYNSVRIFLDEYIEDLEHKLHNGSSDSNYVSDLSDLMLCNRLENYVLDLMTEDNNTYVKPKRKRITYSAK